MATLKEIIYALAVTLTVYAFAWMFLAVGNAQLP